MPSQASLLHPLEGSVSQEHLCLDTFWQSLLRELASSQLARSGSALGGASFVQKQGRLLLDNTLLSLSSAHALLPCFIPRFSLVGWIRCRALCQPVVERIPGACSELPAPPSLLRALLIITGCRVAEGAQHRHREQDSCARSSQAERAQCRGDAWRGWLCSPEPLWRADKLPASCSFLESVQGDGG